MSVPVIQVDNVGTRFVFTIRDQSGAIKDVSSATVQKARFKASPNVAAFERATTFLTDGTDGKLIYVTVAGDLPTAGPCWQRQAFVDLPGEGQFYSEIKDFPVKANL